jgi:predicted nucleic acid-binding protein
MAAILLDTNILAYTLDPRDIIRQEQAIALLLKLEEHRLGRLSVQCLSEFTNVAIAKHWLSFDEIIVRADAWKNIFPVYNLTPQIVLEAARGVRDYKLAYYDAQIWAAARLNQVPVVFSEDFQDGQSLESVRFTNPFASTFKIDEWI